MKRLLACMLALLMLMGALVGCGKTNETDRGAEISVYLGAEIRNWDPALTYMQDSNVKFFSLVYEGLTRINNDGELEYALAKDVKIIEDEEKNEYKMQIELVETAWSDGRPVSADDVIYAWKRILEPEFTSTACAMLYDIENARAVRAGDMTIDDLGLEALDTTLLQITFEGKIDYDLFLENCASPALVPLREDVVSRFTDISASDYWAKKSSTILCSGPFCVKNLNADSAGKTLALQRNDYYRALDANKDGKPDAKVKPFRLNINFGYDAEGRATAFSYNPKNGELEIKGGTLTENADKILYLADVAVETKGAVVTDALSAFSLYMNTRNEVLSDARVREALSISLDRAKIAEMLGIAKPATGLVPYGVYYTELGGAMYRDKVGALLDTEADTDTAKKLIKEAGVKKNSEITLVYYKSRENAKPIMEYVKKTWEKLGFKVTLEAKGANQYFSMLYPGKKSGEYDFDVLALDYQTLSTNAFSVLAPFAVPFSGMGKDTANNNFDDKPGVSGYANEKYDQLIEEAYAAETREAMAEKLAEAEKLLLKEAPIIPLAFNLDTYLANSKVLSKIGSNHFGGRIFTKMKVKNYEMYRPTTGATAAK